MSWTDEQSELLKKLWADGLSASQIAAELGGITRNAIIGKVHRLGLSGRAKSAPATPRPRRTPSSTRTVRISRAPIYRDIALGVEEVAVSEAIDLVIPIGQRRTLLELTEQTCRWPTGDPCSGDFFYCGGNPVKGVSYCAYHARMAYQPAAERRRGRPSPSQNAVVLTNAA